MRPIDKGKVPLDKNGDPIRFTRYQQSRGHLVSRIGTYCSYCERTLNGYIDVEHVQPKNSQGHLKLEWDNFLLACINCNSIKGKEPIILDEYLWPDKDNTLLAFQYTDGGLITISLTLTTAIKQLAEKTIKLTGLDRYPSLDPLKNPEMSDTRWRERRTTYDKAKRAEKNLVNCNVIPMREQIVDTATATGFFSIWMSVFKDDSDMLQRLLQAFPGTSHNCFDTNCVPINRHGGKI